MRSENEMYDLILELAKNDDRSGNRLSVLGERAYKRTISGGM